MNKLKQIASAASVLLMCVGFGQQASAAPILFCNDGPGIDLVNDGCISGESKHYPDGGDGVYSNAGGGDSEAAVEQAIFDATGSMVDIFLYAKTPDSSNPFSSDVFSVTGFPGPSGTWDILDDAIEIAYITIKAANSFALYDVQGANSGTWSTVGILNNGGQQPGVSHISFWTVNSVEVPEPATALLLGAGLLGLWRRKAAK